jgi:hypothetical protein
MVGITDLKQFLKGSDIFFRQTQKSGGEHPEIHIKGVKQDEPQQHGKTGNAQDELSPPAFVG